MAKVLEFLKGKKAYIVSLAAILTAVGAYLDGSLDLVGLIAAIFGALGLTTLRAGIAKINK